MASSQDLLWLGAHKTGTTYLQSILAQSRFALANARILYLGMQAFRSHYTKPLLYSKYKSDYFLNKAEFELNGQGSRLIFDENILALVQDAQGRHGLYPNGEEQALKLSNALGLKNPTLVLGIRKYSRFLPSLYCETLKAQPFVSFRTFQKTRFGALSWCSLVERLLAAFPESSLKVYPAEAVHKRPAELLSWVCGNILPSDWTVDVPSTARREGFSHNAMVALHELANTRGDDKISATDLTNCLQAYPRDPQSSAFDPWKPEEKTALDLLYREDVNAIKSLPRVDFWTPST